MVIRSNILFLCETIVQKLLNIYYINNIFFINVKFYLKCLNEFTQKSFKILLIFVKIFVWIHHAINFFAIEFRAVFKSNWQNENFIEFDESTKLHFFVDFCFSQCFSQKSDSTLFCDFVDFFWKTSMKFETKKSLKPIITKVIVLFDAFVWI